MVPHRVIPLLDLQPIKVRIKKPNKIDVNQEIRDDYTFSKHLMILYLAKFLMFFGELHLRSALLHEVLPGTIFNNYIFNNDEFS